MTTHEEEYERIVGIDPGLAVRRWIDGDGSLLGDGRLAVSARDVAAKLVGHSPPRDLDQPTERLLRHAIARPLPGRRDHRLLHGVLTRSDVMKSPDGGAEHLRRELAQQALDARVRRR